MIREALFPHVLDARKLESGLLILFPDTDKLRAEVETFASLERQCCRFLTFAVKPNDEGLALTVEGPPEAQATLDRFAAAFART